MRTYANRKERSIAILCALLFMLEMAIALPGGYTGRTLLTTSSGCGGCHGSNASSTVVGTISGPATLPPGGTGTYTITVTVGTSTSTKAGVDIAASSGTLAPISSQLSLSSGELTQNTRLTRGTAYSFSYTAPASGGAVTLYATVAGDANTWNWASNVTIVLPVQLSSFVGTRTPSGDIRLDWRTISEVNNYGFFVQRRSSLSSEFTEIANSFIAGHGTTTVPQQYSFTDATVSHGVWYYRLKQVDLDGTIHFSDPIVVNFPTSVGESSPLAFALDQNYPNPFNPTTTIRYTLPQSAYVSLNVIDILGKVVATLASGMQDAGDKTIRFDATGLASGTYFYRLKTSSFVQTRKLILTR